jgi:UDP-glucose 4-epimerase
LYLDEYADFVEIIVTGVAGYIGAHIAAQVLEEGHSVIGVDNLSTGQLKFIDPRINFYQGDVANSHFLNSVFEKIAHPAEAGVIHCAGLKFAGESVKNPMAFYEANSLSVLALLKSMKLANITKLVFSSSCSVYGQVQTSTPVDESAELRPISPYGRSKLIAEMMIGDSVNEGWLRAVSLRYFNVVGNSNIAAYDTSVFNLFPNLYRAIHNQLELPVFGINYDSRDGSCVRDYVHVSDLTKAHLVAFDKLSKGLNLEFAYNLGSGVGYSVLEIIRVASQQIETGLKYKIESARNGDPAEIRADVRLAARDLDWSNLRGLDEMLKDGWTAWQKNS